MNFFSPAEMAANYSAVGKAKASMAIGKMIVLGILAGAFIAFGGIGATTVAVSIPYASLGKFLGACVFPGGLAMVVLAGGELFTGNCLMSIAWLQKDIKFSGMVRNLVIVFFANFIGGLLVAACVVFSHQIGQFDNGLAVSVISTAVTKCNLSFSDTLIRGILCNFLVSLAVWITFAAKDVAGKVLGLFFPVMIFVLCGFEHCVANMYFISAGLFAKMVPAYAEAAVAAGVDLSGLTVGGFVSNLIPATIGNIIGGAICVGAAYWFIYLRKKEDK
ncbi:MAG: formate/nitrite transporter family protein [Eubacterium sp.]|nr:formate/nitrite transporter family protein [Eubacterium sp.]